MFGGGFASGKRDDKNLIPFFEELANQKITVVSIDYRLGFKNYKPSGNIADFVPDLANSITMAVEDLYDATNFILKNSKEWEIDANQLIACGSSAGAISVLQGEYLISSNSNLAKKLPANFNYAGAISFAGAVFSLDGDLKWGKNTCPILFFHGDADKNVPYDQLLLGKLGFFGSKHLAAQLRTMQLPYSFYKYANAAHEISSQPMHKNRGDILSFIRNIVLEKRFLMMESEIIQIGKSEVSKEFTILDYIKANF